MRSQRPRPARGRRLARGFSALTAITAVATVAGCTAGPDAGDSGPPRLTPNPRHDIAAAMVEGRPAPDERLNACELLDLTTEEIIQLTRADMPEVDPTGSGDLGLLCTYGGPGSPERLEAERSAAATGTGTTGTETTVTGADGVETTVTATEDTETTEAEDETGAGAGAGAGAEQTTSAAVTTSPTAPAFDPGIVPDTFAAGVVTPRAGAEAALAGQATLLGVRYACSEVRGSDAAAIQDAAPAAPGAPAPVRPDLATAYIDCVAAPTGGGVEVHTILVSGDELWHITLLKPETPRSPDAEASALSGLHRVAQRILA
ncbi:hypothetical protein C3V38_04120 [Dietzia sp. oral taxon 368]|uniref:hypothetical protein n=1 Tax=Dietzia sp. oral taxon 368 TaxID=712270 RepID=UPI000D090A0D|nr:hypothetical protein [Dietzia sp. oral taxon 368]AVM63706.1 hypothetical protein C3V38_04120 [Dietzia sp. oral taxon 368]